MRLALRQEGKFWNAYLASPDTMEGATLLGSIMLSVVKKNPKHKEAFMQLMQTVIGDALEEIVGIAPDFIDRVAPDGERKQ